MQNDKKRERGFKVGNLDFTYRFWIDSGGGSQKINKCN